MQTWGALGYTDDRWTTARQTTSFAVANKHFHGDALSHRCRENSLFGQLRTGLEEESVKGCVLVGNVRRRSGALEVQAAHDDVEHCCHRCQLHAIKHCWQLWRDGVHIWLVGVHDCSEKQISGAHFSQYFSLWNANVRFPFSVADVSKNRTINKELYSQNKPVSLVGLLSQRPVTAKKMISDWPK